jgi:hypothetical protein
MSTTTTTTTTTTGITREELKALRGADTIVFRWNTELRGADYGPIGSSICATLSHDPGDGFGKRELSVSVPAVTPVVIDYGNNGTPAGACAVFSSAKFCPELVTALQFARTGDLLVPEYVCSNNSETLRDAGLHMDETKLRVRRGGKTYTFMLHAVCIPARSNSIRDVAFR